MKTIQWMNKDTWNSTQWWRKQISQLFLEQDVRPNIDDKFIDYFIRQKGKTSKLWQTEWKKLRAGVEVNYNSGQAKAAFMHPHGHASDFDYMLRLAKSSAESVCI